MQTDLSHLGTPLVDRRTRIRLVLRVLGPALLLPLAWVPLRLKPLHEALGSFLSGPMVAIVVMLMAVAVTAAAVKLLRTTKELSEQTAFEPLFNGVAVGNLRSASPSLLPMSDGEHAVETFMLLRLRPLATGKGTPGAFIRGPAVMCWVVWTNRSVRIFRTARREWRLDATLDLGQIAALSREGDPRKQKGVSAWMTQRLGGSGWLEISLHDGQTIAGAVQSPTVVERVIQRFESGTPQKIA
jgi:hypothetical protein